MGICPIKRLEMAFFDKFFAVEDTASSSDNALATSLWSVERMVSCHGTIQSYEIPCESESVFGKKETLSESVKFEIVSTKDPEISLFQKSSLLIIATIG